MWEVGLFIAGFFVGAIIGCFIGALVASSNDRRFNDQWK